LNFAEEESLFKKEHECAFSYLERCAICEISYDKDENDIEKLQLNLARSKELFEGILKDFF
jgi:hypothetical protein